MRAVPSRAVAAALLALLLTPGVLAQDPQLPPGDDDPQNGPDLYVRYVEATPTQPVAGEPVEVCATFRNYGRADPGPFAGALVHLGEEVAYERFYELPVEGVRLCTNLTLPAGPQNVTAIVDVDGEVDEWDENNNRRVKAFQVGNNAIDLYVESFRVTPREPDTRQTGIQLIARIANGGDSLVKNATVGFLFDGNLTSSPTLPPLEPGQVTTVREILMVSDLPGGNHVVTVRIDPDDTLPEANRRNNEMNTPVRIPPPEGPDLTVIAVRFLREDGKSAPVDEGDMLRLEATIANRGTVAAPKATLNFTLDDGTPVGSTDVPELPPGELVTVSALWLSEAGNWTVRATVEPADPSTELNATNHARTTRLDVQPPIPIIYAPALAVESVTHAPSPAVAGRTLNLTATVRNRGNAEAPPFLLGVHVNGEEVARKNVGAIAPGGTVLVLARWTPPTEGTYTVDAILLRQNGTADANATKDAASAAIQVHERGYRPPVTSTPEEEPAEEEPPEEAPAEDPVEPTPTPPTTPEPPTEPGRAEAVALRAERANGTTNGYTFTLRAMNPTNGLATAFRVQFLVDGAPHGAPVDVPGITPMSEAEVTSPVWTGDAGAHTVEARITPVDGSTWPRAGVRTTFTVDAERGLPLAPALALLALGVTALRTRRP